MTTFWAGNSHWPQKTKSNPLLSLHGETFFFFFPAPPLFKAYYIASVRLPEVCVLHTLIYTFLTLKLLIILDLFLFM